MQKPYMPLSALTLLAATALPLQAVAAEQALDRITLFAVEAETNQLLRFQADTPDSVTARTPLTGMAAGERIVGIDYRVAYGVLFALGDQGHLYTVDVSSGALQPVGQGAFAAPLPQGRIGFDFNPAADRIRIVGEDARNLRAHPESGALVDAKPDQDGLQPDGTLRYTEGDAAAGRAPQIVAAAYSYNQQDEKLTTNYAIDAASGTLVMQGSLEGAAPVVSPNTGLLTTVGALGTGPLKDAHFDISDVSNTALAALAGNGWTGYRLFRIDLASGAATPIGTIGKGAALSGLAIEP